MEFKDDKGKRIPVTPAADAIWERCGTLHIPVRSIPPTHPHFGIRWDKYNERWLGAETHPDRKRKNAILLP